MIVPFTSLGKEVLRGKKHIADVITPELAQLIAAALNQVGDLCFDSDMEECASVQE